MGTHVAGMWLALRLFELYWIAPLSSEAQEQDTLGTGPCSPGELGDSGALHPPSWGRHAPAVSGDPWRSRWCFPRPHALTWAWTARSM